MRVEYDNLNQCYCLKIDKKWEWTTIVAWLVMMFGLGGACVVEDGWLQTGWLMAGIGGFIYLYIFESFSWSVPNLPDDIIESLENISYLRDCCEITSEEYAVKLEEVREEAKKMGITDVYWKIHIEHGPFL